MEVLVIDHIKPCAAELALQVKPEELSPANKGAG